MVKWNTFAAVCDEIPGSPEVGVGFREAAVDSRAVQEGDLFVPLKGERTDGHLFIEQALENGAAGVIVQADFYNSHFELQKYFRKAAGKAVGIVPDTLKALQQMARKAMLEHGRELVRIGVTGSNGKTTTKELIGAVLSTDGAVFINKGNLNSEIGLCQEALRLKGTERYAVFEMGMNRKGEMDILADIVRPDYAVITNIGTAHIGLIGSVEGIAAEKKKIFSRFTGSESGFIHEDEPFFHFLADGIRGRVFPYGKRSLGNRIIEQDRGLSGSEILFPEGTIRFPLIGSFNRKNMYAAYVLGRQLGISFSGIRTALESVEPLFGRGQIIEGEVTVILDCYNANYDSMREALTLFGGIPWEGRKTAVLGDMAELGDFTDEMHTDLGRFAASIGADRICFFGPRMAAAYEAAMQVPAQDRKDSAGEEKYVFTEDIDILIREMKSSVSPGDLLLLKGSRSIELERVLQHLPTGENAGGNNAGPHKEKTLC